MIYTVTFNPSLDYIVSVDHFKTGLVNRTQKELMFPGGKGINVSMVLQNLGVPSTAFGFISGFTGDEIARLLKERQVSTDFIKLSNGASRINVKLRSDAETEINGQGPTINKENIDALYDKLSQLQSDDILVLAGSIPGSMPDSIYMDIMDFLKEKHLRIVVDATKDLLRNVLPYHPFLIKPNHHELAEIFDCEIKVKSDVAFYAKKLQEMGAQNVLVSMAGDGAVLVTENKETFFANAPSGIVKNSVGAGDSMVAGFLAGFLLNNNYKEALLYGLCTGSASAFSDELASKKDVEALLCQNQMLID